MSDATQEERELCIIIIMISKPLFVLLVVCFVSDYSYGQKDKKFFRKDYRYLEASQAFYKIHTTQKTWSEAKRVCALEGAGLFYPENETEVQSVLTFWKSMHPFEWVFIGISDLLVEGVFVTIDGRPVSDVYINWHQGEPNDADGNEDCVVLKNDGTLNDIKCSIKTPFICKKSLESLDWNQKCNIPYFGYIFKDQAGRCYNFHLHPMSWTDAYTTCYAEESYLAVINTQREADYLVALTEFVLNTRVRRNVSIGAVHLGFHNRLGEGWETVKGSSLDESGYVHWDDNQPDGGKQLQCGSMFFNGHLNAISCDKRCFFICEHEVNLQSTLYDDELQNERTPVK